MPTTATTVAKYLAALPKDRRDALKAIRKVIRDNLDSGYREGMQYGMPAYFVPLSVYPPGYHCDPSQPLPYLSFASQKNHMAVYLFCVYTSEQEQTRFRKAWLATGKKLDMGKSCIRFKKLDDVALDVIADTIKRTPAKKFVAHYESLFGQSHGSGKGKTTSTKKKVARKTAAKKKVAKKRASGKKATAKTRVSKKAGPASKKRVTRKTAAKKKTARRR